MRHSCEHCKTHYEIPDEKVAGRFLKVRCKKCLGTMHVVGLKPLDASGANGAVWWAALGNEPLGPYREDEVLTLVAGGSVHARTRMWCAGMHGWERVCESETLAWVYNEVVEQTAGDESTNMLPSSVFDRAALLSDGKGYFPDPTLKSGIILLDDEMQKSLQRLASKRARGTRAEHDSMLAPIMAAAIGAGAAMGGVLWFVLGATV